MSIESLPRAAFYCCLIALLSLAFWPESASTQDVLAAVPTNAHAKRYGGWDCDRGYRKTGEVCVGIEVPPNAYLDSFGHGWECSRDYEKANGACRKIELPPHDYLRFRGGDWQCERGYRQIDHSCVAVVVPENAHLTYSGGQWECGRGFRENGDACVLIEVPAEGYLSRSGNDWECNRGYRKRDLSCFAVEAPLNGYLDASGRDWRAPRLLGQRLGLRPWIPAGRQDLHRGNAIDADWGKTRTPFPNRTWSLYRKTDRGTRRSPELVPRRAR
jgi:hypothetical protein